MEYNCTACGCLIISEHQEDLCPMCAEMSERERAFDALREQFDFCGCGDNEDLFGYIAKMLDRLERHEWGEYKDAPYMFFVYWADTQGLTEHGTTIRCSWLTPKGKELLSNIKKAQQTEAKPGQEADDE